MERHSSERNTGERGKKTQNVISSETGDLFFILCGHVIHLISISLRGVCYPLARTYES